MGTLDRTVGNGSFAAVVRRSLLLGSLGPEALTDLVEAGRGVHPHRGDPVLHAGDDTAVVLLSGAAAVRQETEDGTIQIAALLAPGDGYGLTAVLGHHETSADVRAIDDSHALLLPGSEVRRLIATRADVARACLRSVAASHAADLGETLRFAGTSTAERVQARLLELAERFGWRDGDQVHVTLPLTQEELASWARSSRESTAKVLHQLRAAGIVVTGRRELIVTDLPALQARQRSHRPDHTVQALLRSIG